MAAYLDTSALVKLVVREPETASLRAWVTEPTRVCASSDLARTELLRAVRRSEEQLATAARRLLDGLTLINLPSSVFEAAGRLDPPLLRSLDALHLAAALTLGDDLEVFVTYDDRQAEAARRYGVLTVAPR